MIVRMAPRTAIFVLVAFVSLWLAPLVSAQGACENIAENAAYQKLVEQGVEELKAERYEDAVAHFVEAQKICPFDPGVTYYMARAKHLSGACEVAQALYAQAEAQLGAGLVVSSLTVEAIVDKRLEAEACMAQGGGTLSVTCTTPGTLVAVGGESHECPWTVALAEGSYELEATHPESSSPQSIALQVTTGERTVLTVPAFSSEPATDAWDSAIEEGRAEEEGATKEKEARAVQLRKARESLRVGVHIVTMLASNADNDFEDVADHSKFHFGGGASIRYSLAPQWDVAGQLYVAYAPESGVSTYEINDDGSYLRAGVYASGRWRPVSETCPWFVLGELGAFLGYLMDYQMEGMLKKTSATGTGLSVGVGTGVSWGEDERWEASFRLLYQMHLTDIDDLENFGAALRLGWMFL